VYTNIKADATFEATHYLKPPAGTLACPDPEM
jgi:hypothetical protein